MDHETHIYNIFIFGPMGSGKTHLMNALSGNEYIESYFASPDIKYKRIPLEVDGEPGHIQLMKNQRSQPPLKSLRLPTPCDKFLKSAHAIMLVCDLTDKSSLRDIKLYQQYIQFYNKKPNYILIGTKADSPRRVITTEAFLNTATQFSYPSMITSAKTGENIDALLELISREVIIPTLPLLSSPSPSL